MTIQFEHQTYDALIIGARCAGAATGMLLSRQGARVLIIDRDPEVTDTLSTHALMRPAVTLLSRWGLLNKLVAAGTPCVHQTQFVYGRERLNIPIKGNAEIRGLYAPRRWLLDRALVDAACDAGAEVHHGTHLLALTRSESGRVTGAVLRQRDGTACQINAGLVIGADGRNSMVAKMAGAKALVHSNARSATVYTYVNGIKNEGYRWYFGKGMAAGLIPVAGGAHCLFASCRPETFGNWFGKDAFLGATKMFATWEPKLASMASTDGPAERLRRFPGAPGHIRDCSGPGWALVGDAGYFKDPATAHGITDAFLDANRLALAFTQSPGNVKAYQIARDLFAPKFFAITQKIASHDWDFDRLKRLHMALNDCMKEEQLSLGHPPISMGIAA
ncbi:hypothetical protein ROA7450_03473 [Roseovarius albus]|uniref:FAD-binding domain-containing protein n=1 Tax=Roseovarius albus TaxID=1247867 RepID=A0A1X6ZYY4_9RHOB|nr:NAD(P)/FAD-dependent oxidoreductase [Roseovarius albus]SLN65610.1 hypothetical protein ROA7450_03473 [Roseovarius albus]